MFDELRMRIQKNKFATPTNEEAQLVLEVLEEATLALSLIAPADLEGKTVKGDEKIAQDALERMKFISQRPLGQERNKTV